MALIKCPECGKEMSNKAEKCPQCGMPINEIKAGSKTSENTSSSQVKKGRSGMPQWGWILIIVGSLLIVGGIVFFCFMNKTSNSEAVQKEAVAQISHPDKSDEGFRNALRDNLSDIATTNEEIHITNTNAWINFVSSTDNIAEIDKAFCTMSPNLIENIYKELVQTVCHLDRNDAQARNKCKAYEFIGYLSVAHRKGMPLSDSYVLSESFAENIRFGNESQRADEISFEIFGTEHLESFLQYMNMKGNI